jgi:hypothetical protein
MNELSSGAATQGNADAPSTLGPLRTYPEAAAYLRCSEQWLRRNIRRLPHSKPGKKVVFSETDLAEILRIFHYSPRQAGPAATPVQPSGVLELVPAAEKERRARTP